MLIYELYTGDPPFRGPSDVLLFEAICRKKPLLRPKTPLPLKSILTGLLAKDPYKRLGSGARESLEIRGRTFERKTRSIDITALHLPDRWFAEIDFTSLHSQRMPSPFASNVLTRTLSDYRQESAARAEKPPLIADHDFYADALQHF